MAEWPLVGRSNELDRLRSLLANARAGGVVLVGGAGVGKTRLAEECVALLERSGVTTVRVRATRTTSELPFGAMAPLLPAEAITGGDRATLLRRAAAFVAESTADRRLVVYVDDAHLLDELSATLVYQLAMAHSACLVLTVRSGEGVPDPLVSLWKEEIIHRIELAGLPVEAIVELLTTVLGGPQDGATPVSLAVRCQGNVLFLRELVLGALDDGTLRNEGGLWRLVGPLTPSSRLAELVDARLKDLDPEEYGLLELVSIAEPFGLAELEQLAEPTLAETLERRGFLTSQLNDRRLELRLGHPIYGDVLRARMPTLRARLLARSLAETVEGTGMRRREDVLRVATWHLTGGGGAPQLLLEAAQTARWRYDFPLAERLARAALSGGAGFEARLLVAQLASLQGRVVEAEQDLTALAATAQGDEEQGRIALTRMDYAVLGFRPDAALRIAEEAEATVADRRWRDQIAARRAWVLATTEGPDAALAAAEPLLDGAEGPALVWACVVSSYALGRLGRVADALEVAERGHAVHLALPELLEWYPWVHDLMRCDALAVAGRFDDCVTRATALYDQALSEHSPESQAFFAWILAKTVGERGRVHTSARHAREAVALFRQLGRTLFVQNALVYQALASALAGETDAACDALTAIEDLGVPVATYSTPTLLQARAWAVATTDPPRAHQLLEEAATLAERIGDLAGALAAAHAIARIGRPKEALEPIRGLAGRVEGELAAARLAHAEALAAGDAVRLDAASAAFDALGADLLAAEAAADAAVAWNRCGEPRQAVAAERRADKLGDRAEGPVTPALLTRETRVRLTPAEQEAAVMAAAGASNKEIADRLFISVRTVESRLQHVYEKLGVSSRKDLAKALKDTV
jgi:DNA-binding CsgD family transcriptional regulator